MPDARAGRRLARADGSGRGDAGKHCGVITGVCRLRGPAEGRPEQTAGGLRGEKPPGLGVRGLPPGSTLFSTGLRSIASFQREGKEPP